MATPGNSKARAIADQKATAGSTVEGATGYDNGTAEEDVSRITGEGVLYVPGAGWGVNDDGGLPAATPDKAAPHFQHAACVSKLFAPHRGQITRPAVPPATLLIYFLLARPKPWPGFGRRRKGQTGTLEGDVAQNTNGENHGGNQKHPAFCSGRVKARTQDFRRRIFAARGVEPFETGV